MTDVSGTWDSTVNSPMGEQKSTMTLSQDGDSVSGTNAGATGSAEVKDGKIDGNTLTWKMNMTVPMPMTLDCEATVDGDTITGNVNAGAFGAMPVSGTRA